MITYKLLIEVAFSFATDAAPEFSILPKDLPIEYVIMGVALHSQPSLREKGPMGRRAEPRLQRKWQMQHRRNKTPHQERKTPTKWVFLFLKKPYKPNLAKQLATHAGSAARALTAPLPDMITCKSSIVGASLCATNVARGASTPVVDSNTNSVIPVAPHLPPSMKGLKLTKKIQLRMKEISRRLCKRKISTRWHRISWKTKRIYRN